MDDATPPPKKGISYPDPNGIRLSFLGGSRYSALTRYLRVACRKGSGGNLYAQGGGGSCVLGKRGVFW